MSFKLQKSSGFTLVEVIIFIVGLAILAGVILLPLVISLRSSNTGFSTLKALNVAAGRMELIRMQARSAGFANTADLCAGVSPPAVCAASTPSGYTVTSVIGAAPAPNNDTSQYKQVTVTAVGNSSVGNGYAQLISIISNY